MLKFILGVATGAVLAFGFVRFNIELPAAVKLPERIRGNLVSTAIEGDLYDLTRDEATRRRALEVYFANRAGDAAKVDAAAGHPFLAALYRERAAREARALSGQWEAYDKVLSQQALRGVLEEKHGTNDTDALKRAMLFEALDGKPFLKSWIDGHGGPATEENLRDLLATAAASPSPQPEPAP